MTAPPSEGARARLWNRRVLLVFAPILIFTGISGVFMGTGKGRRVGGSLSRTDSGFCFVTAS